VEETFMSQVEGPLRSVMHGRWWAYGLASAALSLTAASGAMAADAPPDNAISEVVVTAQRREERLQDVPVAVTALSGDQLQAAGVEGAKQLTQVTPGLNFTQSIYSPQPTIRGIGTRGVGAGDESVVPIYVNGVYQPFLVSADMQLNNIARVEVLKGPQGTLFGRNATGGAVNIITKSPAAGFSGAAQLSYGRYDQKIGKLYVTGGTDKLAADLAVIYNKDDGYIRDVNTGAKYGSQDDFSIRSQIRFDPTDNSSFTLALGHTLNDDTTASANLPTDGNTNARQFVPSIFVDTQPFTASLSLPPRNQFKQNSASLTGVVHFDGFDVNTVSGYAENRLNALADSDATTARILEIAVAQGSTSFYQELYATSTGDGPFGWIAGGVFYRDHSGNGPKFGFATTISSSCRTRAAVTNLCTALNTINSIGLSSITTESWAGYLQGTYRFTDALALTVGGRYTSEKRTFFSQTLAPAVATPLSGGRTWSRFTPSANITYKLNPRVNLYAKAGEAFKSGLFSAYSLTGIGGPVTVNTVNPEKVRQYEVGVKSDPLPWLRINAAGYYTQYRDLQASARYLGQAITESIPEATIYGGELETIIQPVARLNITGGLSWLHGEITKHDPNATVNPPISNANCLARYGVPAPCGNDTVAADIKGKKIVRTPFFTTNLGANYTVGLPVGELVFSGNVYYAGKSYWDALNRVEEPAHTLVNAEITWNSPDNRFSATLWGENLGDETYDLTVGTSTSDTKVLARPSTYGVRLGYRW
jgi:iron complex outermembrane recepter protein